MRIVFKHVKRGFILLVGGTVLIVGALMIVLPGPGIPVLLVGLAILATEFVWAEKILARMRAWYDRMRLKTRKP